VKASMLLVDVGILKVVVASSWHWKGFPV
jgi:hypothetical protein